MSPVAAGGAERRFFVVNECKLDGIRHQGAVKDKVGKRQFDFRRWRRRIFNDCPVRMEKVHIGYYSVFLRGQLNLLFCFVIAVSIEYFYRGPFQV